MNPFKKAKWIWANNSLEIDDYIEVIHFLTCDSKDIKVRIACDSVYAFYLNDKLIKFMMCSDYPNYKFYDEFKLTPQKENNVIKIQVWHMGKDFQTYIASNHGLIFEIYQENKILCFSNENTKARVMNEFKNGYQKVITSQQGFSYFIDNTVTKNSYSNACLVEKPTNFYLRDIKDIKLLPVLPNKVIKKSNSIIIDMLEETAGILNFDFVSDKEQLITVAYGEYITDKGVDRIIGNRDFSIEIFAKIGRNVVFNPLKRIAGRYLQVFSNEPIKINYLGIQPVKYDHEVIRKDFNDELINKIYQVCLHTLELCMHEHYEDCPWREQALYTLDSRNQMLCGYFAFKGYEYQRHNLILMAQGLNEYNILSICFPTGVDHPIPLFSLVYIKQVYEYIYYTKDMDILYEVGGTIKKIIDTFTSKIDKNNLIPYFPAPFWNFYEWVKESSNTEDLAMKNRKDKKQYDLIINCFYVYAIEYYNELFNENINTINIKKAIINTFYDKKKNVFLLNNNTNSYSQLGNALACLINIGNKEIINNIINDKEMIQASLSMRGFIYDALLMNSNDYKDYIVSDIKDRYKKMLDAGATSFWETELGHNDFSGGGSLCHGWSALPIYYFANLIEIKHK